MIFQVSSSRRPPELGSFPCGLAAYLGRMFKAFEFCVPHQTTVPGRGALGPIFLLEVVLETPTIGPLPTLSGPLGDAMCPSPIALGVWLTS
jgi:hypothetical protein